MLLDVTIHEFLMKLWPNGIIARCFLLQAAVGKPTQKCMKNTPAFSPTIHPTPSQCAVKDLYMIVCNLFRAQSCGGRRQFLTLVVYVAAKLTHWKTHFLKQLCTAVSAQHLRLHLWRHNPLLVVYDEHLTSHTALPFIQRCRNTFKHWLKYIIVLPCKHPE